jgi:hypothetical protein
MSDTLVSLRLTAGESQYSGFTLSSRQKRALFRVGSASQCNWRVYGEGVAAHHFLMLWNGSQLSVIRAGRDEVYCDSQEVESSTVIRSGCIKFGGASITVDSSVGRRDVFLDPPAAQPRVQCASAESLALTTCFAGAPPARRVRRLDWKPSPFALFQVLILGFSMGALIAVVKNHFA